MIKSFGKISQLSFGLLLATQTVLAESRFVEEIIVTADQVEKAAQDTPIAITAVDENNIENFGINDAEDLAILIPSFSRTEFDFTIRGIGRHWRGLGGSPGVSAYFNGIYVEEAELVANESNFFDIQRVEVLRGPQGTLYGQHSIAGAVNFISNPPTSEFEAQFETLFGDHDTEEYRGVVSGPLIKEKLNGRLALNRVRRTGDRPSKAVPGQEPVSDSGAIDQVTAALTMDYFPIDSVELTFHARHLEFDDIPRAQLHIGEEGTADRSTRYSGVCYPAGADCFEESVTSLYFFPPQNSNANQSLPISGDGFGDDLDNEAYLDYKPHEKGHYTPFSVDARWHFAYDQLTLRYLVGTYDMQFELDRPWSAPGGRNHCLPPRCEPGPGGEQFREDHFAADYQLRARSHELQLISNLDGRVNFVTGLFYNQFDASMELEWFDRALFGSYTDTPQNSSVEQFFGPPAFPGWHNEGIRRNPTDGGAVASFAGSPNGSYLWDRSKMDTKTTAAYTRVSIELTEHFFLSLGGRWSRDERDYVNRSWIIFEFEALPLDVFNELLTTDPDTGEYNGDALRLTGARGTFRSGVNLSDQWTQPSWRINLDWQPNDNTLVYGTLSTGYRPGGFAGGQSFSFDEETVLALELGAKLDLLNDRWRLNLAAYGYDYENQQISAVQPVPCNLTDACAGATGFANIETTQNIPESRISGIEVETTFSVTDYLTVGGVYSYMDTDVRDDWIISTEGNDLANTLDAGDINLKGQELVRAPEHKLTAWANYAVPLGKSGRLDLLVMYAYTDEQHQEILNLPINKGPSFDRWDFRTTWTSADRRYRISGFINNVENELGIISVETLQNIGRRATTTSPRMWGVEFTVNLGGG